MNFTYFIIAFCGMVATGGLVTAMFYLPKPATGDLPSTISNTDLESVKTGIIMIVMSMLVICVYVLECCEDVVFV